MQLTPASYAVSALVRMVGEGRLALPEFQRPYVWPPSETAELLRAVARQWPVGTFLLLLLDRKPQFQLKRLEGAPPLRTAELMILDGQQRMTSLYRALTDRADETYYVRLRDDDDLRFEKRARWVSKYPGPREAAADGVISVPDIWSDRKFADWVAFVTPARLQKQYWDTREQLIPGLTDYDIPSVVLPVKVSFLPSQRSLRTSIVVGGR